MTQQKIGDMNGRWGILLKVHLVVVPLLFVKILAWGTWITICHFEDKSTQQVMVDTLAGLKTDVERLDKEQATHGEIGGHDVMESRMKAVEHTQSQILVKLDALLVATTEVKTELRMLLRSQDDQR